MRRREQRAAVNITIEIPGVILGVIEASQTRVAPADAELASEMDAACERMRRELSMQQVAELAPIHAVRAMFRAWGVDPARYRPSAEALLRRGVQGKGLYRVSNVVRSEEHTSELQSQSKLVCRLLLVKKKKRNNTKHV